MQTTAIKLLLALACLLSATADVSISDVTIGMRVSIPRLPSCIVMTELAASVHLSGAGASRVNLLDEEKKTKYIVAVDKDGK